MKFYLISDNVDTQKGMRLAGIDGVVVHTREDVVTAMDSCLANENLGIILITEKLAGLIPERIDEFKMKGHLPLLVVVPDRHGTKRSPDSITRYVRDAIGVRI